MAKTCDICNKTFRRNGIKFHKCSDGQIHPERYVSMGEKKTTMIDASMIDEYDSRNYDRESKTMDRRTSMIDDYPKTQLSKTSMGRCEYEKEYDMIQINHDTWKCENCGQLYDSLEEKCLKCGVRFC